MSTTYIQGQRIRTTVNEVDGNSGLPLGSEGVILRIYDELSDVDCLILFDKATWQAEVNDDEIEEIFPDTYNYDEDERTDEWYSYSGRLWYVNYNDIESVHPWPNFRNKKRNETKKHYDLCKKIYELDMKWKIRHENKSVSV